MKALSFLLLLFLRASIQQSVCARQGCGNGICEPVSPFGSENCANCPFDCGLCPKCDGVCGNQLCEVAALENACNCPADCGVCCPDGMCRGLENHANCPSDCLATLYGDVYDVESRANLDGASIVCRTNSILPVPEFPNGIRATSGTDGSFQFVGLPKNIYTCTATRTGYLPGSNTIDFVAHTHSSYNATIRIGLKKIAAILVGTVFDASNNRGLRGANVSCIAVDRFERNRFTLNMGGYFFGDALPGLQICRASIHGYFPEYRNTSVVVGVSTKQDFYLQPRPANFSGLVIDKATGLGIRNAQVVCKALSIPVLLNSSSDPTGGFEFVNVKATEYRCESTVYGYTRGAATICLMHGETGTIRLYMTKIPSVVRGTVRDITSNATISNALVRCASVDNFFSSTTNDQGVYVNVGVLPTQSLVCDVSANTYDSVRVIVEVPPATTVTYDYYLNPKPGSVTGRVTDADTSTPLSNFTVTCTHDILKTVFTTFSDVTGSYTFPNITAGSLTCSAGGPRYNSLTLKGTLGRADTLVINFPLPPTKGFLIVNVRDRVTNQGLVGATVVCRNDLNSELTLSTLTGGTVNAGAVRIGNYSCSASLPRYLNAALQRGIVEFNTTLVLTFLMDPSPGSIKGTVYDIETNATLPGFTVTCINRRVTTPVITQSGALGAYFISSIESGLTDCTSAGDRYNPLALVTSVLQDDNVTLNFPMVPQKGTINVRVVDSVSGLGIVGATVSCVANYGLVVNTTTVTDGAASLTSLRVGTFTCTASANTYGTRDTKSGAVVLNVPLNLVLTLSPNPGSITGRVFDSETSVSLVGFQVVCRNLRTSASVSNVTDSLGNYLIDAIDVGNTSCTASGDRYFPNTLFTTVVRSTVSTLDIPLTVIRGIINVTVQDAGFNNRALPGATVNCQTDTRTSFTDVTDPSGLVRRTNVIVGRYVCVASATGYVSNNATGNVTQAATLSLVIPLLPLPGTIVGTVVDSGAPSRLLTDATVSCVTTGGVRTQVQNFTSVDGNFNFTGLTVFGNVTCTASRAAFFSGSSSAQLLTSGNSITVLVSLDPRPMTVFITVRDNFTDGLLTGASVTCTNLAGVSSAISITNAQGVANFTLARGNYTCLASLTAYFSGSTAIFGIEAATVNGAIRLKPLPGGLSVTVRDRVFNTIIAGATVTCRAPDGTTGSNVTNALGVTILADLDVNTYNCTASSFPSWIDNSTTTVVNRNAVTVLTILLPPRLVRVQGNITNVIFSGSQTLRGLDRVRMVITDYGNPVANATVYTRISGDGQLYDIGYFNFTSRIPVNVSLSLSDSLAARYKPRTNTYYANWTDVDLTDPADPVINVPLSVVNLAENPARITGTVIDSRSRQPVVDATILFKLSNSSSDVPRSTTTDVNGTYSIDTLPLGSWEITATANEYIPQLFPRAVVLEVEGDLEIANFTLVRLCCGDVTGLVQDSGNSLPLVGATVSVLNNTDRSFLARTTTNASGAYFFSQIPKGEVTIIVSSPGFFNASINTTVQGSISVQPQVVIKVAYIPVIISGQMGVFNAATNTYAPLGNGYTNEVDIFLNGTANATGAVRCPENCVVSSFFPGTTTNYSIEVDWRRAYEVKCFDRFATNPAGVTDFFIVILPVPPLGPGQGAVVNCPMVRKP